MRQVNSAWKLLAAIISLVLTAFVWQQGLTESFDRPSVAPKLSLKQHEMALVAAPVVPNSLRPILVGLDPEASLTQILLDIPEDQLKDREKIIFALLERSEAKQKISLDFVLENQYFVPLQKTLLRPLNKSKFSSSVLLELNPYKTDQFLYQSSCFALGGDDQSCVDRNISIATAWRLAGIQIFPLFAIAIGLALLVRQGWLLIRRKNIPWPDLSLFPLSLLDMVLLISGGFVVLGEVIFPTFILPFSSLLTREFPGPINESLKVFLGYISMTLPTLFILRQQLKGLPQTDRPDGGWLQWNLKPINKAFSNAISGWLMIMPFVLLTGWLMNLFVGDQGGSNPLLDMVLGSKNSWALLLLLLTTILIAPIFEELIFRGTLLPILAKDLGSFWGVIVSALVFALAHLSVGELPPLFVLGIGLGILRLSSGRLFPCAIMHSLWNGITFANLLLLAG
tara:strand:- start:2101 stop:3459 length:1359 start_codon:yes stop_codon:yes gene_type:complete